MTLKTVMRPKPRAADPFYSTPPHSIRLNGYLHNHWLVKIWLGADVAGRAGFTGHRHIVDLLIDEAADLKVGIRLNPQGQYRVSRWGISYCVHLDSQTSAAFFDPPNCYGTVSPSDIEVSPGLVIFKVPSRCVLTPKTVR